MPDMKDVLEQTQSAVMQMRAANDARFAELENKGHASAETEQKVERLNARITELQAQIDETQKQAQRRSAAGGLDGEADPRKAEHRTVFVNFLRKGGPNAAASLAAIQAAISVGVDTEGGYLVPETLDREIERYERNNTPMRNACNVMPLGNENYTKLATQGAGSTGWVGEEEARSETGTQTLAALKPYFGEIYAKPKSTQKALDDSMIDVEAWLAQEVGIDFAEQENGSFTMGNGVKKPKGILAYPLSTDVDGTRAFGSIQKIVTGSAGNFTADKIIDLVHSLKRGYRQNASFMVSNLALAAVRKLKDAQNHYLWQPDYSQGPSGALLGKPIFENDDMPDPAADANAMLFGDFKRAYTIYDVRGVRVLRDEYSAKPFIEFYTTKRVGGMLVQDRAVKVLTLSA